MLPAALHGGQSVPHVRQGRGAGRGDARRAAGRRPAGRAKLRGEAGPWLAEQRMARDILGRIVHRRRTLTPDMRELAGAIGLPL